MLLFKESIAPPFLVTWTMDLEGAPEGLSVLPKAGQRAEATKGCQAKEEYYCSQGSLIKAREKATYSLGRARELAIGPNATSCLALVMAMPAKLHIYTAA